MGAACSRVDLRLVSLATSEVEERTRRGQARVVVVVLVCEHAVVVGLQRRAARVVSTCNVKYSMCNVRCALCNVQCAMCNVKTIHPSKCVSIAWDDIVAAAAPGVE